MGKVRFGRLMADFAELSTEEASLYDELHATEGGTVYGEMAKAMHEQADHFDKLARRIKMRETIDELNALHRRLKPIKPGDVARAREVGAMIKSASASQDVYIERQRQEAEEAAFAKALSDHQERLERHADLG